MDTSRPNVLVIDRSGYDFFRGPDGEPLIDPARFNVFFMTKPVHLKRLRLQDIAGLILADTEDRSVVIDVATQLHASVGLTYLIANAERHLELAAELRETLGLRGMGLAETMPFRDKLRMKEKVVRGGVLVPEYRHLTSPQDVAELLSRHRKVVIKPIAGMGSRDTFILSSVGELEPLIARGIDFSGFEAEEFVEGPMYHVDGIVRDGRVVVASPFRYLNSTLDYASLDAIRVISETDPTLSARLLDMHTRVVEALELRDGVTHLECFLTPDDRLVFCEVAARSGGGSTIEAFEALNGLNLREATLKLQLELGDELPAPAPGVGCVGLVDFFPRQGRLKAVSTPEDFPEPWIYFKKIRYTAGDALRTPIMSGDGAAFFVVTGDNEAQVLERMEEVRRRWVLEVE